MREVMQFRRCRVSYLNLDSITVQLATLYKLLKCVSSIP